MDSVSENTKQQEDQGRLSGVCEMQEYTDGSDSLSQIFLNQFYKRETNTVDKKV